MARLSISAQRGPQQESDTECILASEPMMGFTGNGWMTEETGCAHLGVQVLQRRAEVRGEHVVPRGRPLAPLDERRPGGLQHPSVNARSSLKSWDT